MVLKIRSNNASTIFSNIDASRAIPQFGTLEMLIADVEADEETQVVEESSANLDSEGNPEDVAGALDEEGDGGEHTKKKKEREEGKSLLPFTRVQKIMKADRVRPSTILCT